MEYLPLLVSIISIIISAVAIAVQYVGKIKSENLKINYGLDLQRYKDLKNIHSEVSAIQLNIDRKKYTSEITSSNELNKLITELRKFEELFKINKFLFDPSSSKKIENHLNKLRKSYSAEEGINQYAENVVSFSSNFIEIINNDLRKLLQKKF